MGDLDPELDQDHYAVLRLDRTSTSAHVKRSYRELLKYVKNETERIELHLSYSVLVNPSRRNAYDREQDRRAQFNLFFANEMIKTHNETETIVRKQGVHHYAELHVSLSEIYSGIDKTHTITVNKPCWECYTICAKCRGSGAVTGFAMMPTGVQHRTQAKCGICDGKGYAKLAVLSTLTSQVVQATQTVQASVVDDPVNNERVYEPLENLIKKSENEEDSSSLSDLTITTPVLEDSVSAAAAAVCKTCQSHDVICEIETIQVKVPIGAESGLTFKFPGLGEQIPHGVSGDLIVRLIVDPSNDPRITRHGEHLKAKLSIPFINTIIGSTYDITLPSGEIMHFHTSIFEEVLNPGRVYIIKDKGMLKATGEKGSLLVHFDVDYAACKLPLANRSEIALTALTQAWSNVITDSIGKK